MTRGTAQMNGGAETILIVDDSAIVRRVLSRLLTAEGWHVREAADGLSAWETIMAAPPDLVVTDVSMPGLDGLGLLRRMRETRATAEIPVLLLMSPTTGPADAPTTPAADDCVSKATDGERLLARIRRLLRRRHARRRAA